jgi:hypothetical protein
MVAEPALNVRRFAGVRTSPRRVRWVTRSSFARPIRFMGHRTSKRKKSGRAAIRPQPAPHTPLQTACGPDMWCPIRIAAAFQCVRAGLPPPPAPPTYSSLSLSGFARWVHCVLLGSLLTTLAVQPSRCRRFIGTLFAPIKYAPRALRMERRETKKRKSCL